jgi:chemotaxis response regulator CheB
MIKVVICDDSATCRELLAGILEADPEIQVIGIARDGIEAVQLTRKLRPDVVTMDIHMPRMSGLEATRNIMMLAPTPVIIVSTRMEFEAEVATQNGLGAGALLVLEKPRAPQVPRFQEVAAEFVAAVKSMASVRLVRLVQRHKPVFDFDSPLRANAPPCLPGPARCGRRIRVLVCEDSPTTQTLLVRILSADPDIRVAGVARDGVEAVRLTRDLRPDVVTMDIHMPLQDGYEATRQIMLEAPTPVVMVSTSVRQGPDVTRTDAVARTGLGSGALAVLPTPDVGGAEGFVEAVKRMADVKVVRRS